MPPINPVEPLNPVLPINPVEPLNPVDPVKPVAPIPVAPVIVDFDTVVNPSPAETTTSPETLAALAPKYIALLAG